MGNVIDPAALLGVAPAVRDALERLDDANDGTVHFSRNYLTFGDTAPKNLFQLPANAFLNDIVVFVETAFNSSGTDLLDVGKLGTANHFINDLSVAAAGKGAPTITNLGNVGGSPLQIIGTYIQSVADATTGKLWVTALWTPQAV